MQYMNCKRPDHQGEFHTVWLYMQQYAFILLAK